MVARRLLALLCLLCLPTAASAFGGVRLEELEAIAAELGASASPCDAPSNPCGEALYLSPLIASDPAKARQASEVVGLAHFEGSHSGLITVDEASGNALFFWFLPAQRPTPAGGDPPPTIMWLQGGPGAPSTYGMFTEIGPVIVGPNGTLSPRPHTWNAKYNLLIVDNPAGVGFSQLGDASEPVRTEEQVGLEMTEFLRQFSLLFPELRAETAGIFIAGESCTPPQPPLSHAPAGESAQEPCRGSGSPPQPHLAVASCHDLSDAVARRWGQVRARVGLDGAAAQPPRPQPRRQDPDARSHYRRRLVRPGTTRPGLR